MLCVVQKLRNGQGQMLVKIVILKPTMVQKTMFCFNVYQIKLKRMPSVPIPSFSKQFKHAGVMLWAGRPLRNSKNSQTKIWKQ